MESVEQLLYRCVKELDYVHSVENCDSGLCKSAEGESLIKEGMTALGVTDLSAESLPAAALAASSGRERELLDDIQMHMTRLDIGTVWMAMPISEWEQIEPRLRAALVGESKGEG